MRYRYVYALLLFALMTAPAQAQETGTNDFRISTVGVDGDVDRDANDPAVAYNTTNNQYLVVWHADDEPTDNELEIYGEILNADGSTAVAQFKISTMGPANDADYDAVTPDVAYNAAQNSYLVVWRADDTTGLLVNNEEEIYGQVVSNLGALTGARIRLSDVGADGVDTRDAFAPAVACHASANLCLVVWHADDQTTDDEVEIYGQFVDVSTQTESGTNDFRLSDMGPDNDANYDAFNAEVAYNATEARYLVVWEGEDNIAPLVDDEREIFGQLVSAAGAEVGPNDFRISDMGTNGDANIDGQSPAVASGGASEFYVAWNGDDDTGALVDNEFEIYGQRINASTGAEAGTNDVRLSVTNTDGNAAFDANAPAVTYNTAQNQYVLAWQADDQGTDNEIEVYVQAVDATGTPVGPDDFRVSDMGTDGSASFQAIGPDIAYSTTAGELLVIWFGDDNTGALADQEFEIFGQRLTASTLPVELVAFEARVTEQAVHLHWRTASETNNAGFAVEMKPAAHTAFDQVGWVDGSGTTQAAQVYSFTAPGLAPGRHTFRLRQVDFDGTFAYSPEVEVQVEVPGAFALSPVYPNPFNPSATFTLAVAQPQHVRVALYDALGREALLLHDGPLAEGQAHAFTLDGTGLPSGLYTVRAVGASFEATQTATLLK